uniref:Uncharacterized protein n=2 Tax=Caenorhabditis japonica TaxID=281687 RepID=A0A8R1EY34_CAEJA
MPAIPTDIGTIDMDLRKTLAPYFSGFNKTTEQADAEGSMKFMHPQGVIVQKNTTSTFGKEGILAVERG